MNDYLTNLSARSFDRTDDIAVVRPRLPSLFEPVEAPPGFSPESRESAFGGRRTGNAAQAPLQTSTEYEPEETGRSRENDDEMETSASASFAVVSAHRRREKEIRAEDIKRSHYELGAMGLFGKWPGEEGMPLITGKPRDYQPPEPHVRIDGKDRGSLKTTSHPDGQAAPVPRDNRRHYSVQGQREEWPAQYSETRNERAAGVNMTGDEPGKRGIGDNDSSGAKAEERPHLITPAQTLKNLDRPYQSILNPWKNFGQVETSGKREPTVQVTIGRIEVRATTAPLKNRPEPKAPAALSLDDYLKQRRGGGR